MQTEELYNIIEAYLVGTMSEEERIRFEKTMDADPALAADVQLHRELAQSLSDPAYINMRMTLDDVAKEFRNENAEPKTKGSAFGKWLWLLAGMGVILILAMWFWPTQKDKEQGTELPQLVPIPSDTLLKDVAPVDTLSPSSLKKPEAPLKHNDPFKPNPSHERAMTLPGNAYYVIKEGRVENERLNNNNDLEVRFQALLTTALEPPTMHLEFLDNRLPNGNILYRLPVQITALNDNENIRAFGGKKTWQLAAKQQLKVTPGLYYQRLVIASDQQALWWSKSEIK